MPNKKSVQAGRVVASRYNQIGSSSVAAADGRKRSLPDDDRKMGAGVRRSACHWWGSRVALGGRGLGALERRVG